MDIGRDNCRHRTQERDGIRKNKSHGFAVRLFVLKKNPRIISFILASYLASSFSIMLHKSIHSSKLISSKIDTKSP